MKKLLIAAAGLSILPALAFAQGGAAGKWTGEQQGRGGAQPVTLELKVDGDKLTGTFTTGQNAAPISDGKVDGSKISFKTTQSRGGNDVQVTWSGEVNGDELTLTRQGGGGGGGGRRGGGGNGGGGGGGGGGGRGGGGRAPITLKRAK
jgi:hypothetical protein